MYRVLSSWVDVDRDGIVLLFFDGLTNVNLGDNGTCESISLAVMTVHWDR